MEFEILDAVLLCVSKIDGSANFNYIYEDMIKVSESYKEHDSLISSALQKLVKDEYIHENVKISENPIFGGTTTSRAYYISFEGRVFLNQGG